MRKFYYPAFAGKDEDSDSGVSFPDFPGCVSAGETVEEALLGAQEALAGHVALMLEDGEDLPEPSALEAVAAGLRSSSPAGGSADNGASTVAVTLVPVVPGPSYRSPPSLNFFTRCFW